MFELTPEKYRDELAHKLAELPESPGVYIHRNAAGEVIYVGKAVNLKNRVRSYFQSPKNHSPKVRALVTHIADFSYILVDSETEALTLECNLIKEYRPRYNILLKDDKTFPYVRMDFRQDFPRAELVYRLKNDGARYFGPYLSRHAVAEALDAVRDNFPLRTCKKDIRKAIARGERPCLNYYIGKCVAPCSGQVTPEEYRRVADSVAAFLSGHTDEVAAALESEMQQAAEALEYERAGMLRDRVRAIRAISEKQKAILANEDERDFFALCRLGGDALIYGMFMRGGKIVGAEGYALKGADEADGAVLASFLAQFYSEAYVPREVLTATEPEGAQALEEWLCARRGKKVRLYVPQRGDKKKLCGVAQRNGLDRLEKAASKKQRQWERTEGAVRDLAAALGLEELPRRIECYDISHTMGMEPVASMVVFTDGKPDAKQYRRFKIRTAANDDYTAMREVLARRLERYKEERGAAVSTGFSERPDLLLIDGGKGQLNAALEVQREQGLSFDTAALAERLEELWLPGAEAPVLLERGSPALHLVQRVRDEAHRFAITYHRSLRNKASLASALEEIRGVGPARRRALLAAFPSPEEIRAATAEELAQAEGVDKRTAALVYAHFHPPAQAAPPEGEAPPAADQQQHSKGEPT